MKKTKDIASAICLVMILGVFAIGMIYWPNMPKDHKVFRNLYYITTASVLYMLSWLIFIIANNEWLKGASCLGIGIFSVNLYVELFLDPTNWTRWDFWLIIFVSVNMFLSVRLLDKVKNKSKDAGSNNDN